MANNSGKKILWKQIDHELESGWFVLKMDGSKFGAFRLPKIELGTMDKYYSLLVDVVKKVFVRFQFLQVCYIIDDEFHFLFHSKDIGPMMNRVSKAVVLPTSYTTALVNQYLTSKSIKSNKSIDFGELCYDGRLIKLTRKERIPYFDNLIDLGKLFIGNIIVGEGRRFLRMSMNEIINKSISMKVNINKNHSIVFGRLIDRNGLEIRMHNLDIDSFKYNVLRVVSKCKLMNNLQQ